MRPANPMLLRVDARAPQTSVLREVVRVLKAGGLAVLPTETVYGVAADPAVAGAEDRIYAAKARDRGKPIPLLAASLEDVERAGGRLGPWARRLAYKYWPGPLTQVLECGGRTEGFRVPDHPVALAVLKAAGGVLRVTSANVSGQPAARDAAAALQALGSSVGVVLDAGPSALGRESTVADVTGSEPKLLREGAISAAALLSRPLVLFVCTGNVCRSPMAEALLRRWLGPDSPWEVRSAGVSAAAGMPASGAAREAMAEMGIDLGGHRSQPVTDVLIDAADLVVVMTQDHKRIVLQRFPGVARRVFLLNAFSYSRCDEDVCDPIGMSTDEYRRVRDEMDAAMPDLVLHLHELLTSWG